MPKQGRFLVAFFDVGIFLGLLTSWRRCTWELLSICLQLVDLVTFSEEGVD